LKFLSSMVPTSVTTPTVQPLGAMLGGGRVTAAVGVAAATVGVAAAAVGVAAAAVGVAAAAVGVAAAVVGAAVGAVVLGLVVAAGLPHAAISRTVVTPRANDERICIR